MSDVLPQDVIDKIEDSLIRPKVETRLNIDHVELSKGDDLCENSKDILLFASVFSDYARGLRSPEKIKHLVSKGHLGAMAYVARSHEEKEEERIALIDKIMSSERVSDEYKKRLVRLMHEHGDGDCSKVLEAAREHVKDLVHEELVVENTTSDRLVSVGGLSLNAAVFGINAIKALRDGLMESYPVFHRCSASESDETRVVFNSREIFLRIEVEYSSVIDVVIRSNYLMNYHRIMSVGELFTTISVIDSDIRRLEGDSSDELQKMRRENIFSFI